MENTSFRSVIADDWLDIGHLNNYITLTFRRYDNEHVRRLIKEYPDEVREFTNRILSAKRIFLIGNGGSLSTASHLALDWSKVGGKDTTVIGENSHITAYGNDTGYENVFLYQLRLKQLTEGDCVVILSGSGNSYNIIKPTEQLPLNRFCAMSGRNGKINHKVLTLPVDSDNIRVIEDCHLAYGHCITEVMEGLQ